MSKYKVANKFLDSVEFGYEHDTNVEFVISNEVNTLSFDLTLGVIDNDALVVFTSGHCHSLALALYHKTGWPIYWLGENCIHHENCQQCLTDARHFVVLTPTGEVLDITGISRDLETSSADWGGEFGELTDALSHYVFYTQDETAWSIPQVAESVPFAEVLLKRLM